MKYQGRGRPKLGRPAKDYGTPELQNKRRLHLTEEILDGYLRRGIISTNQHWCGIHFRWLHTLRYGIASVKAVDTTHTGGRNCNSDDLEWKLQREEELGHAETLLKHANCYEIILNICVFNVACISLQLPIISYHTDLEGSFYTQSLINGLDILETLWFSAQTK